MASVHDFDPRNLPPEFLRAIGLVTAAWAQTDAVLEMLIAGTLGLDMEYGAAVTTHMPQPLRDSIARSVAEIRLNDLDALDELDAILDRVAAAAALRNAIAHHTWGRVVDTGVVFTVKQTARGTLKTDLIPMTVDKCEADAEVVYQVGMDLMRFMVDNGLMPPIPPTRPRGHKTKAARKARTKKG